MKKAQNALPLIKTKGMCSIRSQSFRLEKDHPPCHPFLERLDQQKDILLVDDSPMNLYVLESILKIKLGRQCYKVDSGIEAVKFCEQ